MNIAIQNYTKPAFNFVLNKFFLGFENILGGARQETTLSDTRCMTVKNENGVIVDTKFPVVIWGTKGITLPGDIVWGELTYSEKNSIRSLVVTRFDGVLLSLSAKGLGDEYLEHSKKLFLERLLHLKPTECPEACLKAVCDYMLLCVEQGFTDTAVEEEIRPQYNVGTRADMFNRAMEKELGFERSGHNSKNMQVDLVVTVFDKNLPGVTSPLLAYVGPVKSVKGKTKWGKLNSFAQDSKKRSILGLFDSETNHLLSGRAAHYAKFTRNLLVQRFLHLEVNECPVKVLENVLRLINQWFRVEDSNHDLFSQDYCLTPKAKKRQSVNPQNIDNEDCNEDKDDSSENVLALSRMINEGDLFEDEF